MNLSKKLVLALAGTSLVAPAAASAQEIASLNGRAAVSSYTQQQVEDRFMAWESRNQVTSVNQFSDVQPTDWAYQALSNLVEKYGCVAGYPDGTFKGKQALSRYEAAALLNSCLDRVTEATDELQKLLSEFKVELATIKGRVDKLDSKVGKLEAQQFSTTTKLKGEVNFILGGIPNYGSYVNTGTPTSTGTNNAYRKQGNTTLNYDVKLSLDTSYTGQDLLKTRLRAGNFSALPFGSSSQPFKLDKSDTSSDAVYIDRLYYTFPVGKDKSIKLTAGALVRNTELSWIPTAYNSAVLDFFTTGGSPGTYNKATGQGFGFQWKQKVAKGKPAWLVNTNYVVAGNNGLAGDGATTLPNTTKQGGSGADSNYGVFNADSGINWLTQIGYAASNWGAAVAYRYGTTASSVRDGNGLAGAGLLKGQSSSSISLNAYWQPIKTGWFPSISAGYGYNFVNGSATGTNSAGQTARFGPTSSASWFGGFQWDDAFIKGNAAGIAFGQPAFSNSFTQDSPWLIEWFYRFQVSDKISITPTLFYGTGISNNRSSTTGGGSGNRTNGTTFDGLGGVIQTTFRF